MAATATAPAAAAVVVVGVAVGVVAVVVAVVMVVVGSSRGVVAEGTGGGAVVGSAAVMMGDCRYGATARTLLRPLLLLLLRLGGIPEME